jgi:GTP-binding protein
LIDGRHSPQTSDLNFINRLGEWEIPFCLVFTKADKETQAMVQKNVKSFLDAMRKTWQFLPRHFVTSVTKKLGRLKILDCIEEMNEEFGKDD